MGGTAQRWPMRWPARVSAPPGEAVGVLEYSKQVKVGVLECSKAGKGRVLEYSKQGNGASQRTAWRDSLSSVTPIALASAARSDCKRAVSLTNML